MGENQIHLAEKVKLKPLLSDIYSKISLQKYPMHLILRQLCICLRASFVHVTAA